LCEKSNPHGIVISLEPESAALFVLDFIEVKERGVRNDDIETAMNDLVISGLPISRNIKYDKYMILDCGGGTVDVCVHRVLNSDSGFTVRECYKATGGAWGGIYVEKNFVKYLERIFSQKFIKSIQMNWPTIWSEIMRQFEFLKRQMDPPAEVSSGDSSSEDDEDEAGLDHAVISLPYNFITECEKLNGGKSIENIVKDSNVKGAKIAQRKLVIKTYIMQNFIMEQINLIVEHIQRLKETRECQSLRAIFLVGGFSECKMLQHTIYKIFSNPKCDIVIPVNPSMAIVKGSIKFGFNPTIISQRVAKCTYGLGRMRKFQIGDKEEYKYVTLDGRVLCKNAFLEMIHALVPITRENCHYRSSFVPVEKDQNSITVKMYKADSENIKYTTEPGVEKIAQLRVPMPGEGLDRTVEVTVDFSGTEIFASVKNLDTGETNFVSVDFLTRNA